jgi:hypothetical protein
LQDNYTKYHNGKNENNNYVKIVSLENEIEAHLLRSILEERGIPHSVISFYDTALDGLYVLQKGWGYVNAPSHYRKKIIGILEDLRKEPEKYSKATL